VYCFIYCMLSCVLVDIVHVSVELPVGVNRKQLFEEDQFLGKESKRSSPPAYSTLSYIIA
jgi:hypothetical protein